MKGWVIPFCPTAGAAFLLSFLANLLFKQTNRDRRSVTPLHYPLSLAAFSRNQPEPLLLKFKPSLLLSTGHVENGSFPLFCTNILKIALICFSRFHFPRPNHPRPFPFSIRLLIPAHLVAWCHLQAVFWRTPARPVVLHPFQLPMGYSCSTSHLLLTTSYFGSHPRSLDGSTSSSKLSPSTWQSLQRKGHLLI